MTSKTENFYKNEKVAWDVSKPGYLSESGEIILLKDEVINVDLFRDTDWIWTNIPSTIDTSKLTFADGYTPSANPLATPFSVRDHKHKLTEINLRSTKTPVEPIEDNYPAILSTEGLTKMEVCSDFLEKFDIYTKVFKGWNHLVPGLSIDNVGGTLEQIILPHTPNLTTFSVGASGKLRELYVDDFSHVTSLSEAFYGNNSLEYISPMYLDSCEDLSYAFACCQFSEFPTTLHNTSNVKSTHCMFNNCKNITTVPLFDTSNVTDMYGMFIGCTSLTTVPLFDTSNVTFLSGSDPQGMGSMFSGCTSLTTVPLFNTQKNTFMYNMFNGCTSLTTVPLFDTSNVTDMERMFYGCTSLTTVPLFNTQKVGSMSNTFNGCTSLTSVPLFNTQKVTTMFGMFWDCTSLTTVPAFNTSNVQHMHNMFDGCTNLTSVPLFDTQNVLTMGDMFRGCSNLTSVPLFDTKKVWNMQQMFYNCGKLTSIPAFDTSNVSYMDGMFYGCSSITTIPAFNTSGVYNMENMFYGCSNLTSIPELDASLVGYHGEAADNMFYGCTSLTDCGGFKNLLYDIDLRYSPLTHESAMNIINKVATTNGHAITFSKVTYDTLSEEEIKIATDKHWGIRVA